MEVYRISTEIHANALTSSGSMNRWNLNGQKVLYVGSSRSLSTLELVVHKSKIYPKVPYKVMIIFIVDSDALIRQINIERLPDNWRTVAAYPFLQAIGSEWYVCQESLLLKVPSVVIPQEYNYAINTEHPDFSSNVSLIRTEDFFFDERLFL